MINRRFSETEDQLIKKICIEKRTLKVADALKKVQLEIAVSLGVERGIETIKKRMYHLKKQLRNQKRVVIRDEKPIIKQEQEKVISELDILHILSNYDRKSLILIKSYIDFKIG